MELCTRLGLIDYQRGVKLGGNGYWLYTGPGAALEWALLDFFNREHYAAGYTFLLPPHMLTEENGYAAGQFPKFHDDVYHIAEDSDSGRKSFLLPTAETAILNVYRDEILPAESLPVKAFAYTPCYRREAGSYRSEERGTIRGHQFNKVEMFQFCVPEDAESAHAELHRPRPDAAGEAGPALPDDAARHQGRQRQHEADIRHRGVAPEPRDLQGGFLGLVGRGLPGAPGQHPVPGRPGQANRLRPHPQRVRPGHQPACCRRSSSRTSSPTARSWCPSRCAPGSVPTSCGHRASRETQS